MRKKCGIFFFAYLNKYQPLLGKHNIFISVKNVFLHYRNHSFLAYFSTKKSFKISDELESRCIQISNRSRTVMVLIWIPICVRQLLWIFVDKGYCATVHYSMHMYKFIIFYTEYRDIWREREKTKIPCENHERKHFSIGIRPSYPFDLINKFIKSKMGTIGSLSKEYKYKKEKEEEEEKAKK